MVMESYARNIEGKQSVKALMLAIKQLGFQLLIESFMDRKFYIDESGNTGDLIVTEKDDNFSSQEYFTLACVGLDDEILPNLENFIKDLKSKYRVQSPELKFSKIKGIFGKKIGFILELVKYIEDSCDILIEVVDKKYFLSTTIVNCLINPPYLRPNFGPEIEKSIHLKFSQWVYDHVTTEFLTKFTNISRNPSEEGLIELFDNLLVLARETEDSRSQDIFSHIEESIDDFNQFKSRQTDREAYTYFLPLPDTNKRGQLIGVLPYISSFYNIHARLNHLFERDLSEVLIIHDNQSHFDDILMHYHESAVENTNELSETFDVADFVFINSSELQFQDDKNYIGLQISDLLAGFLNKSIPHLITKKYNLTDIENKALHRIMEILYWNESINFVLPDNHNKKLFKFLDDIAITKIRKSILTGACLDKADEDLLKNLKNQAT